ncbi:MAG: hypothetical protein A2X94_03015 [Bdellovibrionales bacterium GWB1_55_8]|nr:MAG: hypothetical protein A2X94_03015 [Bdellovibrionales bacterium GWB1_55_8]
MRQWMPLWAVACLIIMSVGTVWLRLAIVGTSYDINQADREIRELQLAREYSTVKYTGLRSPRRLELLARTRFGLSQPRPDQIIRLSQETKEVRLTSSTAVAPKSKKTRHEKQPPRRTKVSHKKQQGHAKKPQSSGKI